MQLFFAKPEQIVIKVEIFELTLGMENIFLIHVHVYHLVMFLYQLRDIILNWSDIVIYKQFMSCNITRKTTHTVIDSHNVGIETVDQIIKRFQRWDLTAGRYVDIGPKGTDTTDRVIFGIGMHRDMAFI